MRRVVVSGGSVLTALGGTWQAIKENLLDGNSGVHLDDSLVEYKGLRTRIVGRPVEFELPKSLDRKILRSMSRAALMASIATEAAIRNSKINDYIKPIGGVAYGTCLSAPEDLMQIAEACVNKNFSALPASTYLKVMSHSIAANLAINFSLPGRIIPTNSACTSSSQAIGYGYETIQNGKEQVMFVGGSEELCVGLIAMFDSMSAAIGNSSTNQPRPFDITRSGMVVAEAAGTITLEDYDFATARRANILAEVVGFACNNNATHMTQPNIESMVAVMQTSMQAANIAAEDLAFVHLHGTATAIGDLAESKATKQVIGNGVPVTALKSYFGHTLGAAGVLETWAAINCLQDGWLPAIKNLEHVDPDCADLNFVIGNPIKINKDYAMINNFAFGGVNTSLVVKKIDSSG